MIICLKKHRMVKSHTNRYTWLMNDVSVAKNLHHASVSLEDLVQHLPGLIVVMDENSKFILSNRNTALDFGYSTESSMLGVDAHGMKCPAAECADEFIKQDKLVMATEKELSILDIHEYARGDHKLLLTKKKPFYQNNQLAGTICHCMEIDSVNLQRITATLIQQDKAYLPKSNKHERSYTVGVLHGEKNLSPRESECLFYLLRGKTMKEIGKALSISPRTVETHLEHIKQKLGCATRGEMTDYAILNGFLAYIPESVLKSNYSILLD
jgi:DNA-binding CsgD family transcriptional regulator